jgi:hypothetical protein
MNTHRWIPHVVTQARTVPVETLTGAQRADPLVQAARRILILALVIGSLGADAAAWSGYASVGQASAHQPAGNIRLAASVSPISLSPSHITDSPWMY